MFNLETHFLSFLNLFEAKQNLFDAYKKVSAVFVIILFQCRKNYLTETLRESQVLAIVTSKLLLKTSKRVFWVFFSHNENKEFAVTVLCDVICGLGSFVSLQNV